jgi:hypothetical protein
MPLYHFGTAVTEIYENSIVPYFFSCQGMLRHPHFSTLLYHYVLFITDHNNLTFLPGTGTFLLFCKLPYL